MNRLPSLAEYTAKRTSVALWCLLCIVGSIQTSLIFSIWNSLVNQQIGAWSESLPRNALSALVDSDYLAVAPSFKIAFDTGLFSCLRLETDQLRIIEMGCETVGDQSNLEVKPVMDSFGKEWGRISYIKSKSYLFGPLFWIVAISWGLLFLFATAGRFWLNRRLRNDFATINDRIVAVAKHSWNAGDLDAPTDEYPEVIDSAAPKYTEERDISLAFTNLFSALRHYRRSLRQSADQLVREQEMGLINSAIARTTQTLAHDIRRPFSMLRMAFEAFVNSVSPLEAQASVREVLPEVSRAMASVDGMLQDIMQIGGHSDPVQEDAAPEAIVIEPQKLDRKVPLASYFILPPHVHLCA